MTLVTSVWKGTRLSRSSYIDLHQVHTYPYMYVPDRSPTRAFPPVLGFGPVTGRPIVCMSMWSLKWAPAVEAFRGPSQTLPSGC